MRQTALLVPLLLLPLAAEAQDGARAVDTPPSSALFASHEPIEMSLWADFDALRGDRDQEEEEREGRAMVTPPEGEPLDLSVDIRTRGRYRLQRSTCRFPPLRLDFKKGELDGTFLDGEDKLKLVTHCRDRDDYEQNVLEEYLVYRIFNQISDRSFRVRLARVTYHDTSGGDPVTRWAFLIEDEDRMAERLGGEIVEDESVHPARMVGRNTGPVTLFQYMVGNTDFSLYEDHNVKVVVTDREVIPVPYDFDWTGLVDAPYAQPDTRLKIYDVRERVYRGYCRPDVDFAELYDLFRARRAAIEALIREQPGLGDDERREALEYVTEFYETIGDEGKARREIEERCRRL